MLPETSFTANQLQQQVALPSPEVIGSADEMNVQFGPNLAENQELCAAVTKHVTWEYWWIYELLQQAFWPAWEQIDNAWRARVATGNLDIRELTQKTKQQLTQTLQDGVSAVGQSPALFKQVKAITDMGEQISWQDGVPCRALVPDDVFEHPLYQPDEQSAEAINSILADTAEKEDVRAEYRKSFGWFTLYGCAFGVNDFHREYEDVVLRYTLDQNPVISQLQLDALIEQHKGQPSSVTPSMNGGVEVIFVVKKIKRMGTSFKHTDLDNVFIDPFLPVSDMNAQPCPLLREHVSEAMILENVYDPENNPMGYVNIDKVGKVNQSHYVLSQEDEGPLAARLQHRYNISDLITNNTKRLAVKQKWTAYPLLRINPHNGELDTGDGCKCHQCDGSGKVQIAQYDEQGAQVEGWTESENCPECEGSGKVHPPLKRYVVTLFGALLQETVCLRIQEWPKGMMLPLQYAGDLIEDTACAYPMSPSEIAIPINEQLATSCTQFEQSKRQSINRGWKYKEDSPAASIQNFNKPDQRIPFENDPNEAVRIENNNFDETVTLIPYMQLKEKQLEDIYGASPTVLGEITSGRRSALEVGNAIESAKNPLVTKVDRFNKQMMGGWAKRTVQNLDMFGDRDWIRKKTGRTYFGRFKFFTAVGEEFVKKMAATQSIQYVLQASANDPVMMGQRAELWNQCLSLLGIKNVHVDDGGIKIAINEAMGIITKILGDGVMIPPTPDDPDEIYIGAFQQALKDPYWMQNAPQNLPLLQQRLFMQQQQAMQKAMQQMMLQQQQQMDAEQQGQPNAPRGRRIPEDHGQAMQNAQGMQPQRQ